MGRPRVIGLVVGISALIALLVPASALAGTFNWSLPGDFTTTAPGANPEHKYGAVSWTYQVDGGLLPEFSTNLDGGVGWTDARGDNIADTGGHIDMDAAAGHSVSITWKNPFPSSQKVKITNTLKTLCPLGSLTQSPSGGSVTLSPGRSISVTLTAPKVLLSCTATGALQLAASTPGPTVTLDSPGTTPLKTSTPKLTGTASTGFTDSDQVAVAVYSGTDTSRAPVRQFTASVDPSGAFSVQVRPGLSDGRYTAVATQTSNAATGQSPAVTFRIKVFGPALTLNRPPGGIWIGRDRLSFSGRAGHDLGDASKVTVQLYSGHSAGGTPVRTREVRVHHGSWFTLFSGLALGYYTVRATQSDDAGHTTRTPPHTFRLVSKTTAFGSAQVSGNFVDIPIGCLAVSSQVCRGTVLIVTKHSYRTAPGAPSGPLEVLFAKVTIPGGTMGVISGRIPGNVVRVLRRLHRVQVTVTADLSSSGRRSLSRTLRVT